MTQIAAPIRTAIPELAHRVPLNDWEPDSIQILKFLEGARSRYQQDPYIRETTVSLLKGLGDNDQEGQVATVLDFVRSRVVYVRDPQGGEYVVAPNRLLHQIQTGGVAAGDCDDHVMLLNSMLGSIGFDTKFVGVKIHNSRRYNHVISKVNIRGRWTDIDPCVKSGRPYSYPDQLTV